MVHQKRTPYFTSRRRNWISPIDHRDFSRSLSASLQTQERNYHCYNKFPRAIPNDP
jgi:hypothetical protein